MLRRVRNRGLGQRRQLLDRALALGEQFEQLQPDRARQCGADARQVLEHLALGVCGV
jgi:hypothetical protein